MRDQQAVADDQVGGNTLVFVVAPLVIIRHARQVVSLDELIEADRAARRPLHILVPDGHGGRVVRRLQEHKSLPHLCKFLADLGFAGFLDVLDQLAHFHHPDVHAERACEGGRVEVHVEHALVGMTHVSKYRPPVGAQRVRHAAPVADVFLEARREDILSVIFAKNDACGRFQAASESVAGLRHGAGAAAGVVVEHG